MGPATALGTEAVGVGGSGSLYGHGGRAGEDH